MRALARDVRMCYTNISKVYFIRAWVKGGQMLNRAAIYVFWEKNGIVRDYVTEYLRGLKSVAQKIVLVANGEINSDGIAEVEKLGVKVLQRKNEGVDFWAYKAGLESLSSEIIKYDEIILCNCSCYGPLYPFSEMFDEMDSKKLDFWGITEWPENKGGYSGTWVLSYFMVFARKMFESSEWEQYWESLVQISGRDEAISKHEIPFTRHFADLGFKYDVYCKNDPYYIDMTIDAPDVLIKKKRCPIIKRKAFLVDYDRYLSNTRGNRSRLAFDFISKYLNYDVGHIWQDILATGHFYYISNALQLRSIFDNEYKGTAKTTLKVALLFHLYYDEILEQSFDYIANFPSEYAIIITTPRSEMIPLIKEMAAKKSVEKIRIETVNSRGRAESALLVGCKEIMKEYDLVCSVHDKLSRFLEPGSIGLEFGLHQLDSLLFSEGYIRNIVAQFEIDKHLGMLVPPTTYHGGFQQYLGNEWSINFDLAKKFIEKHNINTQISEQVPPVYPMGAMFWVRPKCLSKIINSDISYEDFSPEPLPLDGDIIHAIERAYPFFVQDSGHYISYVNNIEYESAFSTALSYIDRSSRLLSLRQINQRDEQIINLHNTINNINNSRAYRIAKFLSKFNFFRRVSNG
jgi:rhamnosyltransferase